MDANILKNIHSLKDEEEKHEVGTLKYTIRNMEEDDIPKVLDFICTETDWCTGKNTFKKWLIKDPNAFKLAVSDDDGAMIATCSTLRLFEDFYFFGFYIVKKEYRGKGIGSKVWKVCKKYFGDGNVATWAVEKLRENYKTNEGFVIEGENSLESGSVEDIMHPENLNDDISDDVSIVPYQPSHLPAIYEYDLKVCGYEREFVMKSNCEEKETLTMVAFKNKSCVGFGTIKRSCRDTPIVAPLYADEASIAESLLKRLMLAFPYKKGFYMASLCRNEEVKGLLKKIGCPTTGKYFTLFKRKLTFDASPQKVYAIFDIDFCPL